MNALEIVTVLASGAALVAAVTSLVARIRGGLAAKRELDSIQKADTSAAIASADLDTLGYHLVDRLGATSLRSYASNEELRVDFDLAFNAVRSFLGVRDGDTEMSRSSVNSRDGAKSSLPGLDERVYAVKSASSDAEAWTELARARRDLELRLRELIIGVTDSSPKKASVSQMVFLAKGLGVIDKAEADRLESAIQIANRAIHGDDLAPQLATEAANTISKFLKKTSDTKRKKSDVPTKPRESRMVVHDPKGGWQVVNQNSSTRSMRYKTQGEAINKARDIVAKAGGGEIMIHGKDGSIRGKDTVRGADIASRTNKY